MSLHRLWLRLRWGQKLTVTIDAHNGQTNWYTLAWRNYSTPDGLRSLNSPGPARGSVDMPATNESVNGNVVPLEDAKRYVEDALMAAGWRVEEWGYQQGKTWGFYSKVESRIVPA